MRRGMGFVGSVLLLLLLLPSLRAVAAPPTESFWGAQEFYTQSGHHRYLLLPPPHYDPHRRYELWVNLHGNLGCAGHAIFQYRAEAQQRQVFLLAPQADGEVNEPYIRPDGKKDNYRCWFMQKDRPKIWKIIDEVMGRYSIQRDRVALLGFSAGCEMGWRLLADRPQAFYFFGGVANGFKNGKLPAPEAALRRAAQHVPHFYAAGGDDALAGPMYRGTMRRLREFGFELKTVYPPGVGHALPPSIKTPLLAFMDTVRNRARRGSSMPPVQRRMDRPRARGILRA